MKRLILTLALMFAAPVWAATYYTSHNAGGGGAGTSGDPYTLAEAAAAVSAGDLVLVMATGTYTPGATITWSASGTNTTAPIVVRGAASDGTDDGTVATISGSGLGASTDLFTITGSYHRYEGLRLTAATADGVSLDGDVVAMYRMRIDSHSGYGVRCETFGDSLQLVDCEIDSNGSWGIGGSFGSRGMINASGLSIHDNASGGIYFALVADFAALVDSVIYDNGGDGVYSANDVTTGMAIISGCTIYGNDADGLDLGAAPDYAVTRCIIAANGGYGVNAGGDGVGTYFFRDVCSYNNTSGHTDINGGALPGVNIVTSDPSFASVTDGSEDFTPSNASLILSRGIANGGGGTDYSYFGAIQPQCSGGSGAIIIAPRRHGN